MRRAIFVKKSVQKVVKKSVGIFDGVYQQVCQEIREEIRGEFVEEFVQNCVEKSVEKCAQDCFGNWVESSRRDMCREIGQDGCRMVAGWIRVAFSEGLCADPVCGCSPVAVKLGIGMSNICSFWICRGWVVFCPAGCLNASKKIRYRPSAAVAE